VAEGKGNAFLTGAAGGMGTAIAKALVAAGYRVVLADRDEEKVKRLATELGPDTLPFPLDVTDGDRVSRIRELILSAFMPIDVLSDRRHQPDRSDAGDARPAAGHGAP
jgi:3-hydroxy acid dehydrogenase/malonic semialdehyde reductase